MTADRVTSRNEEEAIRIGMDYIYANPVTRFLTVWGLRDCAALRTKSGRVLDLGCGRGDLYPYVDVCPLTEYVGLDQSEYFLSLARKRFPSATWLQGDAFSLPFEDHSIGTVLSFSVLEHLAPLEDALDEVSRVMTRDGELIFGVPTEGLLFRLGRWMTTKRYIERRVDVDYSDLVSKEHVNGCKRILAVIRERFTLTTLRGIPFGLPVKTANIFLVGRCVRKDGP